MYSGDFCLYINFNAYMVSEALSGMDCRFRSLSNFVFSGVPPSVALGDGQVDRSPTGSGVTARIALQHHKGMIGIQQSRTFRSGATGSLFTGKAVQVRAVWMLVCSKALQLISLPPSLPPSGNPVRRVPCCRGGGGRAGTLHRDRKFCAGTW